MQTLGKQSNKKISPTFLLRSLEYYQSLEDSDPRRDTYENKIVVSHPDSGNLISSINLNTILVSCWTLSQERINSVNQLPWDIFKDTVRKIM